MDRTRSVVTVATAAFVVLLSIPMGAAQAEDDFLRRPDFSFDPPAGDPPTRSPKRFSSILFRDVAPNTEICKTDSLFGFPPDREDVMLLSDTTGSMGSAIKTVQNQLSQLVAARRKAARHTRFGVASYRDESEYSFQLNQALTKEEAAVQRAIDRLEPRGGGDAAEANLPALHAVATDKRVGWSDGSRRLVVWFGDVPGHEPSCAVRGVRHTRQSVLAALRAARISVIALSVRGGLDLGLDGRKRGGANSYGTCVPASAGGPIPKNQALFLTKGTSGISKTVVEGAKEEVSKALAAIDDLAVRITPSTTDCGGIFKVRFVPAAPLLKVGEDTFFKTCVTVDEEACKDPATRSFFSCNIRTMGTVVDSSGKEVLGSRRVSIQRLKCP